MARHKGAVGFEIGTSKLGAYSMEDTLEIFEKEGYVKYKDLDQYFKDCYFDFENKLSEKEFIEKSKKNIMRSLKYRQFINNEVKMCCICKKPKPLKSFYDKGEDKRHECISCCIEGAKKWNKTNRERKNEINSNYRVRDKKRYNSAKRRYALKKFLKSKGYRDSILTRNKLEKLLAFKDENNIGRYETLLEKFGSVLNG